jgi:DNA-binding NtrC family response regulator
MQSIFETRLQLHENPVAGAKAHLIVVDDEAFFRDMVIDYLWQECRLGSEQFDSSSRFLQQYKAADNRIILLDYDFGRDTDGLTVLKEVRRINPIARVIMLSAQDDLEVAVETLRCGAMDYFLKTSKTVLPNVMSSVIKLMELERLRQN